MGPGGVTTLNGYYTSTSNYWQNMKGALNDLLSLDYDSLYTDEYQATLLRSTLLATDLGGRLNAPGGALEPDRFSGFPQGNSLASQLKMVARMIKICSDPALQIQRQIFFVRYGSFDTHLSQISNPALALGGQGLLLQYLSKALKAFDDKGNLSSSTNNSHLTTLFDYGQYGNQTAARDEQYRIFSSGATHHPGEND